MRGIVCQWNEHFGVGIILASTGRTYSIHAEDLPQDLNTRLGKRVEFRAAGDTAKNVRVIEVKD